MILPLIYLQDENSNGAIFALLDVTLIFLYQFKNY